MRKLLALVAMCLLLTSCMRADMQLNISADDKVNGELTIAFDEAALAQSKVTAKQILENQNLFGNSDATGLSTSDFKDGNLVGKTYRFTDLPLSELAKAFGSDGTSLSIRRQGNQIITSGVMDMSQGLQDLDQKSLDLLKTMSSTIKITYPGKVVATKGLLNGNTVTWVTKLGQKSDFATIVNSDFVVPEKLGTPTSGSTNNYLIIGAVVFVLGLVGLSLGRRRRPADSTSASADTPAA